MTDSTMPDPPRRPRTRRRFTAARRRRLVATLSVATLLTATGVYAAVCAAAPMPAPVIELDSAYASSFAIDDDAVQRIVDTESQPTAVAWADGNKVWSNDDRSYSIASITKVVTALVILEHEPYDPDAVAFTWGETEEDLQYEYLTLNGVVYLTPLGTDVTQRQALSLMLLRSANDYATAYAHSVFGDAAGFREAVEDWADRHGLESLHIVEPSGMDEHNTANVEDLIEVARLALDEPVIAEIVRMPRADIPWGDRAVRNTNPLFGELPGIIGLKTGTLSTVGHNLAAAQQQQLTSVLEFAPDRDAQLLSVVLARDTFEERTAASIRALQGLDGLHETVAPVLEGTVVGTAVTVDGRRIDLVTDGSAAGVLLPGEQALRHVAVVAVEPGPAGQTVGSVQIEWPEALRAEEPGDEPRGESSDGEDSDEEPAPEVPAHSVPIVTAEAFEEPDFWWRVTHPAELFGW